MTVEDHFPVISVVLPTYKEPVAVLKNAIDSILNQTFKSLELIVILDNPQNNASINLLKEYAVTDSRFVYIINETNLGITESLNKGINRARGAFIARQDADDFSRPDRFERQYAYLLANPEVGVLGTLLLFIDNESDFKFEMKYQAVVGKEINRVCPVGAGSVLIRKEIFLKHGSYKERLAEDYDLWMRWYSQGVVLHNLQEILYDYYAPYSIRIKRIKPYLINTIKLKWKNHKKMHFTFMDYAYLLAQMLCALLPAVAIHKLFYFLYGMNKNEAGKQAVLQLKNT